jgi:hypothetical protein
LRETNQVANYALLEARDNLDIRAEAPRDYAPRYESRFSPDELELMYRYHALFPKWYEMDYQEFLQERRKRMAAITREGFAKLADWAS